MSKFYAITVATGDRGYYNCLKSSCKKSKTGDAYFNKRDIVKY